MIPKSYKGKDLLGRKATINSDTRNKGGNGIGAGAKTGRFLSLMQ